MGGGELTDFGWVALAEITALSW